MEIKEKLLQTAMKEAVEAKLIPRTAVDKERYRLGMKKVLEVVYKTGFFYRAWLQQCKESTAKRVIGSCSLIFKGSGFYVTDNRSSEYVKKEKVEKGINHG